MNQQEIMAPPKPLLDKIQLPDVRQAIETLETCNGFSDLLTPVAENMYRFEFEAKKQKFLKDKVYQEERQALCNKLKALAHLLEQANSATDLRTIANATMKTNEHILQQNVKKILEEAQPLERTYRELDTYFKNASTPQRKVENLTLLNVRSEDLLNPAEDTIYDYMETLVIDEADQPDQLNAYSILVIPELWRSEQPKSVIERYAKLADTANMCFLTDFEDVDSVKEALQTRKDKKWQGIQGSARHFSKLVLFVNHLVLRGEDKKWGLDELRASPAMAAAGKMYLESLAQPVAGVEHGSIDSRGLAFKVRQTQVSDLANVGLNALITAYERDMIYEAGTAYDGDATDTNGYALKRYAVVRVFDYVQRVMKHYLGQITHRALSQPEANKVRDTIVDFLKALIEYKVIAEGSITKWQWNERQPDRIDMLIAIQPIWAVRSFVYSIEAQQRNVKITEK